MQIRFGKDLARAREDAQIAADLANVVEGELAFVGEAGERGEIEEPAGGVADEGRGEIEDQFVHAVFAQQRAVELEAAFGKHFVDAAPTEFEQQGGGQSKAKKKASGSSSQTKSITNPKNQHSDFATEILGILDSESPMKRGRLYGYILSNVLDNIDCNAIVDKHVSELSLRLINMHSTIDKNKFKYILDKEILSLILNTMEQ